MRVRTHPGEVLRCEYLEPLEMSATALAEAMDVPANRITDIVRGRRDVTADTALRLAKFFNTTPDFWMSLQTAHDLSKAAAREVPALKLIADRAKKILPQYKAGHLRSSETGRFHLGAASPVTQPKSATEKMSKRVAAAASKVMQDPKASKEAKSAAASALTQKVKSYHPPHRPSELSSRKSKK
jgi:addiction module HigA family antidote